MTRDQLGKAIYDISHLTGSFKLRSGQVSNEYFDKYRFESQPQLLKAIAQQMTSLLPSNIDALAGLEMGGIPVATALSFETGLPVLFVRKKAKDYGTCQFAEGFEPKGKRFCIVEDVITTGGQVLLSTQDLRNAGAFVDHVVCVIHRGQSPDTKLQELGLQMKSLFTMAELNSFRV
ncbi:MAG: orotate phosphoribosyltransferase [Bdellovibrionota bacterium]